MTKPNGHGDLRGPLPVEDFSLLEEPRRIRTFSDIPDLMAMTIRPVEWIVDRIAAHKNMTLWTGVDGTAKTFLMQSMAIAVGSGAEFLGRRCRKTPVLYLDYENPDFSVRDRLDLMASGPLPDVRFWGTWLDPQPVPIGGDVLLKIAQETRPLMIFDPFRYSHLAEENDSTAMMAVMKSFRSYATAGASVVIVHHPAKAEGSTGRGSSVIRGACDLAWTQELNDETGQIALKCGKNRCGDKPTIHVQPDFEAGTFAVVDSPEWVRQQEGIQKLRTIITADPGLSVNQIFEKAGGSRNGVTRILKEHTGREWRATEGPRRSVLYFPLVPTAKVPVSTSSTSGDPVTGTVVLPLIGSTTQYQVTAPKSTGTLRTEHECRIHGEHEAFYRSPGGSPVCGICHPQVTQ